MVPRSQGPGIAGYRGDLSAPGCTVAARRADPWQRKKYRSAGPCTAQNSLDDPDPVTAASAIVAIYWDNKTITGNYA